VLSRRRSTTSGYNGQPDPTAGGVVVSCAPSTAWWTASRSRCCASWWSRLRVTRAERRGLQQRWSAAPGCGPIATTAMARRSPVRDPRQPANHRPELRPRHDHHHLLRSDGYGEQSPQLLDGGSAECADALGHVTSTRGMTAMDDFCRASMPMGCRPTTRTAAGVANGVTVTPAG